MQIDIDKLNEEELIDLNNRIVARLRFLNQMRAHSQMLDFRIGDRITFQPEGRPPLFGIITRYNKKPLRSSPRAASTGTWRLDCCARQVQVTGRRPTTQRSSSCASSEGVAA